MISYSNKDNGTSGTYYTPQRNTTATSYEPCNNASSTNTYETAYYDVCCSCELIRKEIKRVNDFYTIPVKNHSPLCKNLFYFPINYKIKQPTSKSGFKRGQRRKKK